MAVVLCLAYGFGRVVPVLLVANLDSTDPAAWADRVLAPWQMVIRVGNAMLMAAGGGCLLLTLVRAS
jgi:hypothetical protein